jgi:hypothetical protein
MIKRTTGRLLLTLLVTTGLAGTLNNSSLSPKERKQAISLIKNSRKDVLNNIAGLSPRQMNYKVSAKEPSINELIMTLAWKHKEFSEEVKKLMMAPSNSDNRLKIAITDEQLLANNDYSLCRPEVLADKKSAWKDASEATRKFASLQAEHIKYIRNSTEDLRNHVVNTSAGWIDCYQYFLMMADQSNYIAAKIREIRSSPRFPKK